jgi:hypothetical protein
VAEVAAAGRQDDAPRYVSFAELDRIIAASYARYDRLKHETGCKMRRTAK